MISILPKKKRAVKPASENYFTIYHCTLSLVHQSYAISQENS